MLKKWGNGFRKCEKREGSLRQGFHRCWIFQQSMEQDEI